MTNDPVTVDLESTVESIMCRIGEMSYPEDYGTTKLEVARMLKSKMLPSEIVAFMRCTEEVNKDLEEAVALARMEVILTNAAKRLGLNGPRSLSW